MIRDYSAPVTSVEEIGEEIYHMTLHCPPIAQEAAPGQFVMIRPGEGSAPLLRRPLGILAASEEKGTFDVLFRQVGLGTAMLAQIQPGQLLQVRGVAGKGFSVPKNKRLWAVAGTLGVVPLLFLRQRLGGFEKFLLGLPGEKWAPFANWIASLVPEIELYSEDGTLGRRGVSVDGLKGQDLRSISLAVCGPNPMMKALYKLYGDQCDDIQISLERRMACGFGGCYGCVTDTAGGRCRVCADGPVFQAKEVLWDEL